MAKIDNFEKPHRISAGRVTIRAAVFVCLMCTLLSFKPFKIAVSNTNDSELAFLKTVLPSMKESDAKSADVILTFSSSWEFEAAYGQIAIAKTYMVPKADSLAGKTNTTLAACLNGQETIVPLCDIAPPDIALRVDGLAATDDGYPLVKITGITITPSPTKKSNPKKIAEITAEISMAVAARLAQKPAITWLAAGGDVMLERGAGDILLREGAAGIFGKTARYLKSADIAVINLEGSISSRGAPIDKKYTFRFSPAVAGALKEAGIDAVLSANNHAYDWGANAFSDTLVHLKNAGIGILGAGMNIIDAASPWIFQTAAAETFKLYGIASFPRENSGWDGITVAAEEEKAGILHAGKDGVKMLAAQFSDSAFDVVFFHGGDEWTHTPNRAARELCTELIKAGADMVIGSHPHIAQGFEWIDGKPVFWSLGNYVFAGMDNTGGGTEGLFLYLGFHNGRLVYLEPIPVVLSGARTTIAPQTQREQFYRSSRKLH